VDEGIVENDIAWLWDAREEARIRIESRIKQEPGFSVVESRNVFFEGLGIERVSIQKTRAAASEGQILLFQLLQIGLFYHFVRGQGEEVVG